VDPYWACSVMQVPEPLSPRYRSRVQKVSCRSRSHSGKHLPGPHKRRLTVKFRVELWVAILRNRRAGAYALALTCTFFGGLETFLNVAAGQLP
jgi:hypothetical protein